MNVPPLPLSPVVLRTEPAVPPLLGTARGQTWLARLAPLSDVMRVSVLPPSLVMQRAEAAGTCLKPPASGNLAHTQRLLGADRNALRVPEHAPTLIVLGAESARPAPLVAPEDGAGAAVLATHADDIRVSVLPPAPVVHDAEAPPVSRPPAASDRAGRLQPPTDVRDEAGVTMFPPPPIVHGAQASRTRRAITQINTAPFLETSEEHLASVPPPRRFPPAEGLG